MTKLHADNLRKIASESPSLDEAYTMIDKHLQTEARLGGGCYQIQVISLGIRVEARDNAVNRIIETYKAAGFNVKRERGFDQRDGQSWDYLEFDWR